MISLFSHTACRTTEFKRPKEVVSFLEGFPNSEYFVNEIFDTDDVKSAENIFNDLVICDRDTLVINFGIPTLVDQLTNSFKIGIPKKKITVLI